MAIAMPIQQDIRRRDRQACRMRRSRGGLAWTVARSLGTRGRRIVPITMLSRFQNWNLVADHGMALVPCR